VVPPSAALGPTGSPSRLDHWLLRGHPPLGGRRRFVFYAGSLALFTFLNDGLSFTLGSASPFLYEPRGLSALLGIPYLGPAAMRALMAGVYLAWLCAAVGLFTRAAKVATAIGVFLAVGFEQAYVVGSNHTHYLLLYSLVCLSFTTSDGGWSVDEWLRKRSGSRGRSGKRPDGLGATGLPLQILLILTVSTYFAAGMSKLVDGGLGWADGTSLQYYIGTQIDGTSFGFVSTLRSWVAGELWLTRLISIGTLVLELGAPLALVSRPLRHLFIPAWIAMHMGILVLMRPNYWIHSWCLLVLLVDWQWLQGLWLRRPGRGDRTIAEAPVVEARPMRGAWIAGLLVAPVALAPPLLQIEWYPLTHVPMYGTRVAPGMLGGIPEEAFGIESRAREIARQCAGGRTIGYTRRCPWRVPRHLGDRLVLELHGPGRSPSTWDGRVDRLRFPVIDFLAAASSEDSEDRERSGRSLELAERVRALLAAEPPASLEGYDSFVLQYRLNEGTMRLVAGLLDPPG
jgi:hypothetical protein